MKQKSKETIQYDDDDATTMKTPKKTITKAVGADS